MQLHRLIKLAVVKCQDFSWTPRKPSVQVVARQETPHDPDKLPPSPHLQAHSEGPLVGYDNPGVCSGKGLPRSCSPASSTEK